MPSVTTAATKKRATFQLSAPGASEVCIAGTFNDWNPSARPLKRGKGDTFRTWMSLPVGTYEYRFIVDGEWRPDPASEQCTPSPYGGDNSILVV